MAGRLAANQVPAAVVQAGRYLADALAAYRARPDVIVLGLPRGGVPVAFEVAQRLDLPMDIFLVRKLGMPSHEEFAIGAIASGGVRVIDWDVVRQYGVSHAELQQVIEAQERELARREHAYRGDRAFPRLAGRTVIVVDDGLATGASMRAAVAALRAEGPARIVVAVPVAPKETCRALRHEADDVVCALTPEPF